MAEFSYIARNSDGVRIEDSITASSLKDATELLLADNLSIVKMNNDIYVHSRRIIGNSACNRSLKETTSRTCGTC